PAPGRETLTDLRTVEHVADEMGVRLAVLVRPRSLGWRIRRMEPHVGAATQPPHRRASIAVVSVGQGRTSRARRNLLSALTISVSVCRCEAGTLGRTYRVPG